MYSLTYNYSNLLTFFCRGKFVMISEVLTLISRSKLINTARLYIHPMVMITVNLDGIAVGNVLTIFPPGYMGWEVTDFTGRTSWVEIHLWPSEPVTEE